MFVGWTYHVHHICMLGIKLCTYPYCYACVMSHQLVVNAIWVYTIHCGSLYIITIASLYASGLIFIIHCLLWCLVVMFCGSTNETNTISDKSRQLNMISNSPLVATSLFRNNLLVGCWHTSQHIMCGRCKGGSYPPWQQIHTLIIYHNN